MPARTGLLMRTTDLQEGDVIALADDTEPVVVLGVREIIGAGVQLHLAPFGKAPGAPGPTWRVPTRPDALWSVYPKAA